MLFRCIAVKKRKYIIKYHYILYRNKSSNFLYHKRITWSETAEVNSSSWLRRGCSVWVVKLSSCFNWSCKFLFSFLHCSSSLYYQTNYNCHSLTWRGCDQAMDWNPPTTTTHHPHKLSTANTSVISQWIELKFCMIAF